MHDIQKNSGFTLIELIAIISIISFMLFLSIPRFQESIFIDHTKKVSRLIMLQVRSLKEMAVSDHKLYTLHIDIDKNWMWVTNESMSEEEVQNAVQFAESSPEPELSELYTDVYVGDYSD